jgi:hypothetical protein
MRMQILKRVRRLVVAVVALADVALSAEFESELGDVAGKRRRLNADPAQ